MRAALATSVAVLLSLALVAVAFAAGGGEALPVAPYDALWLSKTEGDIALLQERVERIRDRVNWYVQEMARRDGKVGWQLSAPDQENPRWRWVKPPETAQPKLTQEER